MKKGKPTKPLPSGEVTFIFTDMVESTPMMDQLSGESSGVRAEEFVRLIQLPHDLIIEECVSARGGVIVKGYGDGFLIAFSDSEQAVLCALDIQENLAEARIRIPGGYLQIRVGMNTGPAKPRGADYAASAVNKARRVESSGVSGKVYLSQETHGLVRNKLRSVSTYSAGDHHLKGFGVEELFVAVRTPRGLNEPVTAKSIMDLKPVPRHIVLIGDSDKARFEWFKSLLVDIYLIDAMQATTLTEVKKIADSLGDAFNFRVVLLADSLPLSLTVPKADPKINFSRLEEKPQFIGSEFACIVTRAEDPDLDGLERKPKPHLIRAPTFSSESEDRERAISDFGELRAIRPVRTSPIARIKDQVKRIAEITEWDQGNRTLRRQIRSLSDFYDLADGYKHLLRLLRDSLNVDNCTQIEVEALVQGNAEARMFHVIATAAVESKEYVLRVLAKPDKLESEVRGYNETQMTAGVPGSRQQVATLRTPITPLDPQHPQRKFIVHSGQWYAIHYDFLGGKQFGKFIDLETALTTSLPGLEEKTRNTAYDSVAGHPEEVNKFRLKIFDAALDGLSNTWYGNRVSSSRRMETIWTIDDDPGKNEDQSLPPYRLKRRIKGLIQDFLESREALIGPRLFSNWNKHLANVLVLVSDNSTMVDLGRLGGSLPFTFSLVHGDLHASNVLLCLKYDQYPFVIDLPTYQSGHCLQDFARLEVEVKLVLLDRQVESPEDKLPAYDYSISQANLWIELENALLAPQALDKRRLTGSRAKIINWKFDGYLNNVDLCYRLVILLRRKAFAIQQQQFNEGPSSVSFAEEYLPALLYHSAQAISDPSLPVIKRLLAVHSAGSIFERLK